jgi:hypothetical protein
MLILAMRSQNVLFKLDLDEEIQTCEKDVVDVFGVGRSRFVCSSIG